jgi:hypothetical protein
MPGAPHTTPGRRRLAKYTIRLHGTRERDGKKALAASKPWPVHRDPSSCILSDAFAMNRVRWLVLFSEALHTPSFPNSSLGTRACPIVSRMRTPYASATGPITVLLPVHYISRRVCGYHIFACATDATWQPAGETISFVMSSRASSPPPASFAIYRTGELQRRSTALQKASSLTRAVWLPGTRPSSRRRARSRPPFLVERPWCHPDCPGTCHQPTRS